MKNFFLSTCGKIGRFFWSWGFLKFVLWTITLVVLFYVEEDWRGARSWAVTKEKWEAKGETFDINRVAPPPVPDDENLAALPLFKMDPDPDKHGVLAPLGLNRAFNWNWENFDLPRGGNWEWGKLADAAKNKALVAAAYRAAFKAAPTTQDSLAQFDALVPAIGDLRSAAVARPYCRFPQCYTFEMPDNLYLSLLTAQIKLSKFLSADASLALDTKHPDVALADILALFKLMSGTMRQPLLVSGLISIGLEAINLSTIYEGLATHVWNDAQLSELENQLAAADFLADYQNSLRGEACLTVSSFERLKPKRRQLVSELYPAHETVPPTPQERPDYSPLFWPDGWIDLLKVRAADSDLKAAHFVDLPRRVLSPEAVKQYMAEIEARARSVAYPFSIWTILSGEIVGPLNNASQKFAVAQVRLDEARIACALERYHLAKGGYPVSLEVLAPTYIEGVPHDVINAEPYHYRLRTDGTFLLYSVGWNQTDEGGNFALTKDNPKAIDYEQGDWVWPTPQPHSSK